MPLQKQVLSLSFGKGINTKVDSKQVMAGEMLTLENAVFKTIQQIKKRNGYNRLGNTIKNYNTLSNSILNSTVSTGNTLAPFADEIMLSDGFNLFSYSSANDYWVYKGKSTINKITSTSVVKNTFNQSLADSAINPQFGFQLYAWEESDGSSNFVKYSLIDSASGQVLINDQSLPATTSRPRCVYVGGRAFLFYFDSADNNLHVLPFDSTGALTSQVIINDIDAATPNYDVMTTSNAIYICYHGSASNTRIKIFSPFLIFQSGLNKLENSSSCVSLFQDPSNNIWVIYNNGSATKAFIVNQGVTLTVLPPTIVDSGATASGVLNITGVYAFGKGYIFYDKPGATVGGYYANAVINYNTLTVLGIIGSPTQFLSTVALASKAFLVNNIPHLVSIHDAQLQPTYFLCNLYNNSSSSLVPVANIAGKIAESAAGTLPSKSILPSINQPSANVFQVALQQKDLLFTSSDSTGTVNTYTQTGVISASMDFSILNPQTQVLGNNLHIGSGLLLMYDGTNIVEHNFNLYPEGVSGVAAAGGALSAGQYGYQVVYEWTDAQGQVHKSSPSPILSLTAAASDKITLTIPTLQITNKTLVGIRIYRTAANGTIYYRLNNSAIPITYAVGTNTITYIDTAADSTILANEQIYTTGEVENIAAPPSVVQTTFKNRIVLVPSDNPYSWWFSKQVIPGSPVEFSDLFVKNIGTAGGPIIVPQQMDDKIIFFKENSIYYVVGNGPAASGANDDFSDPQIITSDVGCTDPDSVVLMPMGIMFKSHKGIYLLDRSLSVSYVGAKVEAYNSNDVLDAELAIGVNQVRFLLDNETALVYDYFVNQWSVFTNISGVASVISNNVFNYLRADGNVYRETEGVFNDDGTFIRLRAITSWLQFAGVQGYQRVYKALILGDYKGAHRLRLQVAYDFNPAIIQQDYIDAFSLLDDDVYGDDPFYGDSAFCGGDNGYPLYQWRLNLARQKCQSIQLTIEDVQLLPINEGLDLSAIGLEVGIKAGLNKVGARKAFG